jgi:uncharacterized protein YjiS (DUF1127 family)
LDEWQQMTMVERLGSKRRTRWALSALSTSSAVTDMMVTIRSAQKVCGVPRK